jgi:hypothetical protein
MSKVEYDLHVQVLKNSHRQPKCCHADLGLHDILDYLYSMA